MFIVIVLVFAVCMLPNHLIWLYRTFNTPENEPGTMLSTVAYWLTYTNSMVNPVIYGMHPRFRLLYANCVKKLVNFCSGVFLKRAVCDKTHPRRRQKWDRSEASAYSAADSVYGYVWTPDSIRKRISQTFSTLNSHKHHHHGNQPSSSSVNSKDTGKHNHLNHGNEPRYQIPIITITPAADDIVSDDVSDHYDDDVFVVEHTFCNNGNDVGFVVENGEIVGNQVNSTESSDPFREPSPLSGTTHFDDDVCGLFGNAEQCIIPTSHTLRQLSLLDETDC